MAAEYGIQITFGIAAGAHPPPSNHQKLGNPKNEIATSHTGGAKRIARSLVCNATIQGHPTPPHAQTQILP